ncbi:nitrous oxide reductase [Bacteroidetes/Chlorobi group bacterium Naka2016]|nr:MAG: nitrous oxide reductase [Bacteroidetes/Chlorobi group bacterium Naka2016]
MLKYQMFGLIFLFLLGCSNSDKPEGIKYGVDVCSFCKMTIVDPKWGAELMTTKGKIHKFDVVECMIAYANTILKPNEIKRYWTINFLKPKEFIDATTAIYIRTLQYPSPMGLNSLAIESLADTTKLKLQPGYEILNWKDVIEKAKEEYLH